MQVDYLILADAVAAAEGKQYIHGAGWDTLGLPQFPAVVSFGVAARLRTAAPETAAGVELEIDLVTRNDLSLLSNPPGPPRGRLGLRDEAAVVADYEQRLPIVWTFSSVPFAEPGSYAVVLRANGVELARTPLIVTQLPPADPQAGP